MDDRIYYQDFSNTTYAADQDYTNIKIIEFNQWNENKIRPREAVMKILSRTNKSINEAEILRKAAEIEENIVKYYYSYELGNKFYIIMEFCKGGSLKDYMYEMTEKQKFWQEDELIEIYIHLSKILSNLHSHHISHRDIKPDNIFITGNGIFKLGDMGESKAIIAAKNTIKGTFYYFSPYLYSIYKICKEEHLHYQNHLINPLKEDVYSLGKTFLEMALLKGILNFNGFSSIKIKEEAMNLLNKSNYSYSLNNILVDMLEDTQNTQFTIHDFVKRFENLINNKEISEENIKLANGKTENIDNPAIKASHFDYISMQNCYQDVEASYSVEIDMKRSESNSVKCLSCYNSIKIENQFNEGSINDFLSLWL